MHSLADSEGYVAWSQMGAGAAMCQVGAYSLRGGRQGFHFDRIASTGVVRMGVRRCLLMLWECPSCVNVDEKPVVYVIMIRIFC